jgi:hypothetical protein
MLARDGAPAPAQVQHGRRGDGELGHRRGHRPQKLEVVHHDGTTATEGAGDRGHGWHVLGLEHHALDGRQADAVEPPQEVEVPEVSPVLTVGDGAEAQRLLPGHRRADAAILHLVQLRSGDRAGPGPSARLVQRGRAQETADVVGAERRSGPHGHPPGRGSGSR